MEKEIQKSISLIAVISKNYAIGKDGDQICFISEDLKHFKSTTSGHPIVMGRKTYDALPIKPLPGRKNIVLTSNKTVDFAGCTAAYSIDEALAACDPETENFVIGGENIYRQFMPYAERLYITWIYENFEADAFFPEINEAEWEIREQSEVKTDPKTGYSFAFFVYERNK